MSEDGAPEPALCPSAPAAPGAMLLGLVKDAGEVTKLGTPLPVDAAFIASVRPGETLESRFRFADTCAERGCSHWTGEECGLIGRLEREIPHGEAGNLPRCAIRGRCRWWLQRGRTACNVCSLVVTDTRALPVMSP